ncbi:MAG: HAD family hydrolase [Clostridia bacterium]|nr:HAD family hydrolase [Clostridia bacterium]
MNQGTIKAVMFDLDGTLLDTLDDLTEAVNHALSRRGYPRRTREEVCARVGNGIGKLIERSVPDGASPEETAACLRDFTAYYEAHLSDYTRPYPGILDLLDRLHARGVRVGVVSNKKDEAVQVLCRRFFGEDVLAVGERADIRRKPEPDGVNALLQAWGTVEKAETLYVGDSAVDVATAAGAGLTCVCVTWGFRTREELEAAGATAFIDTPEQLERFL